MSDEDIFRMEGDKRSLTKGEVNCETIDSFPIIVTHSNNYHKIIDKKRLERNINGVDVRINLTDADMEIVEYVHILQGNCLVVVNYTINILTQFDDENDTVGIEIIDYMDYDIQSNSHDRSQILDLIKNAFTYSNEPEKAQIFEYFGLHDHKFDYILTSEPDRSVRKLIERIRSLSSEEYKPMSYKKGTFLLDYSHHIGALVETSLYHDFDGIEVNINMGTSVFDVVEYFHIRNKDTLIVIDCVLQYVVNTCGSIDWNLIGCHGYTICSNKSDCVDILRLTAKYLDKQMMCSECTLIEAIICEIQRHKNIDVDDHPDTSIKSCDYILDHRFGTEDWTRESPECPFDF